MKAHEAFPPGLTWDRRGDKAWPAQAFFPTRGFKVWLRVPCPSPTWAQQCLALREHRWTDSPVWESQASKWTANTFRCGPRWVQPVHSRNAQQSLPDRRLVPSARQCPRSASDRGEYRDWVGVDLLRPRAAAPEALDVTSEVPVQAVLI